METAIIVIAIIAGIFIFWRPFSVFRKEVPEGMSIAIQHGTRILKTNILEDENEMQNRLAKIKEARDGKTWIDVDEMWNSMHPSNK